MKITGIKINDCPSCAGGLITVMFVTYIVVVIVTSHLPHRELQRWTKTTNRKYPQTLLIF